MTEVWGKMVGMMVVERLKEKGSKSRQEECSRRRESFNAPLRRTLAVLVEWRAPVWSVRRDKVRGADSQTRSKFKRG